jgi:hypothetical protein
MAAGLVVVVEEADEPLREFGGLFGPPPLVPVYMLICENDKRNRGDDNNNPKHVHPKALERSVNRAKTKS